MPEQKKERGRAKGKAGSSLQSSNESQVEPQWAQPFVVLFSTTISQQQQHQPQQPQQPRLSPRASQTPFVRTASRWQAGIGAARAQLGLLICLGFSFCLFNGFMNYPATPAPFTAPFVRIDNRISRLNLTPCAQISLDAPTATWTTMEEGDGILALISLFLGFPMSSMTIKTSVELSATPTLSRLSCSTSSWLCFPLPFLLSPLCLSLPCVKCLPCAFNAANIVTMLEKVSSICHAKLS